jgi:hypothetical protein
VIPCGARLRLTSDENTRLVRGFAQESNDRLLCLGSSVTRTCIAPHGSIVAPVRSDGEPLRPGAVAGQRPVLATFGFDVLTCPRCGGRLRPFALIEEAAVISRILRHLGLPTETPVPRPARAPPLAEGLPGVAGQTDDPWVFEPCS